MQEDINWAKGIEITGTILLGMFLFWTIIVPIIAVQHLAEIWNE